MVLIPQGHFGAIKPDDVRRERGLGVGVAEGPGIVAEPEQGVGIGLGSDRAIGAGQES
jgi:hypothetical protein